MGDQRLRVKDKKNCELKTENCKLPYPHLNNCRSDRTKNARVEDRESEQDQRVTTKNKETNSRKRDVRKYEKYLMKSLILAQDERWRRA